MSLFTIEIEGQPIMVFASEDRMTADQFTAESSLHEDLTVFMHEGRSLWDGKAELFVREAHPEEASCWEVAFARARESGDVDADESDDFAMFLVSVTDSTEE